jgi:tetratricopeptide (TPR) repeat protein
MFDDFRRSLRNVFRRKGPRRRFSAAWWMSWIPFWLTLDFYWEILKSLVIWFVKAQQRTRIKDLLWGIPAIIMAVSALVVLYQIRQLHIKLEGIYWREAQLAVEKKSFAHAEMLLDRVLQEDKSHLNDAKYILATVYEDTGHTGRAESLFLSLAPDSRRGYRDAHRRLAVILSASISEKSSDEEIKRMRWHLDAADDRESPPMAMAWGRYSIATRNLEDARSYLEIAAIEFPELWITLGEVNTLLQDTTQAIFSYEKASQFLIQQLEGSPDESDLRISYATVLMRLGRLDEAKLVLEEGLKREPRGQWQTLLAALYVNYHDLLAVQGNHSVGELLEPIAESLAHDPNFGPALERLMAYSTGNTEENVELKSVLARVVAEGTEPALAHLALGDVCWMEGDMEGATFHFERSLSINPKLATVMNNLAWMISHDPDKPDFQRALSLVQSAIDQEPENGSFLDTRGTIRMMMGNYKEALDDLETSLKTVRDRSAVHHKLAFVYGKLGRKEMEEQHILLEQQLKAEAESKLKAITKDRNQPQQ